jgi:Mor family transcriptional regulator
MPFWDQAPVDFAENLVGVAGIFERMGKDNGIQTVGRHRERLRRAEKVRGATGGGRGHDPPVGDAADI